MTTRDKHLMLDCITIAVASLCGLGAYLSGHATSHEVYEWTGDVALVMLGSTVIAHDVIPLLLGWRR